MRLTFLFFEWNVCWMDCRDIYSCSSQDDLRYCNNFWFQSKFESVQHFMIYDHNTCETNDIQPQLYFGKRHLLNISMSPLPLCELLPVQLHRAASTAQCYLDTFYLRYLTGKFMYGGFLSTPCDQLKPIFFSFLFLFCGSSVGVLVHGVLKSANTVQWGKEASKRLREK